MRKTLKAVISAMLAAIMLITAVPFAVLAEIRGELVSGKADEIAENDVPNDAVEYNGHLYKLFTMTLESWRAAENYCESLGGHLATLTSQEENDFVYNYICSLDIYSVYFGLSDDIEEGNWQWVNGETSDYRNWSPGEPNSENQHEDYAMFYYKYTNGKWNDGSFGSSVNDTKSFICEWDYSSDFNSENTVCLATLECIDEGHYTGNEGDSRVYCLDKEPFVGYAPYGPTGTYGYNGTYRYGNTLVNTGEVVNNGLEVWIARWNYTPEISYAYRTFRLDKSYKRLTGHTGLIKSYNTTNFDSTLFFYDANDLIAEYRLTSENYDTLIDIDVSDVEVLKVMIRDNVEVAGGTSFAVYDLFLRSDPVDPTPSDEPAPVDPTPTPAPADPTDEPVEPSEAPAPADPTDEPVEPSEAPAPADPTDEPAPIEPSEAPAPAEPTAAPVNPAPPATGAAALLGIGIMNVLSGLGIAVFRRKRD